MASIQDAILIFHHLLHFTCCVSLQMGLLMAFIQLLFLFFFRQSFMNADNTLLVEKVKAWDFTALNFSSTSSLTCRLCSSVFMMQFVHECSFTNPQGLPRTAGFKLKWNDTQLDSESNRSCYNFTKMYQKNGPWVAF